mmetsp:Transcript_30870/g.67572  ORF Transcript_30870/g.67572 Transcript_30870/m.67572 type:complete len:109 (-) Transcript_30870:173-499(-)
MCLLRSQNHQTGVDPTADQIQQPSSSSSRIFKSASLYIQVPSPCSERQPGPSCGYLFPQASENGLEEQKGSLGSAKEGGSGLLLGRAFSRGHEVSSKRGHQVAIAWGP